MKTPLIFIPGLLCNRLLWDAQVPSLPSTNCPVFADITQQVSIAGMAAAVLHSVPARFALVGFSLGSQVALEIMRVAGERVERLALLSATHGGLLPQVQVAIHSAIGMLENGPLDRYLEAAYPTYVAPQNVNNSSVKHAFFEMAHDIGSQAGIRQMQALLTIDGAFRNLNRITCPTVVIGGNLDHRTTPEAHQLLASEIPNARLVLIENSGHFTPLEQPGAVASELERWLAV